MAEDLKNQPSYECRRYCEMQRAWKIVRDVCEGTLHLRNLGNQYLPIEPAEDAKDFSLRRDRAIFFNAFERALHGLVGMVFRKKPNLADDVPEIIRGREASEDRSKAEGWAENIDLAGSHWTVLAKETFTDAMRDGHSFILVDMPPALPEGSTLADEIAQNRRPYWVSYAADQVINWITASINGQTRLLQITFREKTCEPDGEYGEKEVVRYRVLRPGSWALYEEVKDPDGKTSYILKGQGTTSLNEIPVAVIYARKTGYLRSKPPLLDLALMNVCHYQKYSDYSTYLHIASRPILWFNGRDKTKKIEAIGPYTYFDVDGQNGNVAFAETTGAALGAARDDLADLEQRMSVLGLSLLSRKNPTPTTATQELLDHVKEESDLATAARSLKDALELALKFTIQYRDPKAVSGGSVELGSTIEELTLSPQEVQAYSNMVASKQLSLETLWAMLGRAGKLPEDFNPEKEKTRIQEMAKAMNDSFLRSFARGEDFNQ